MDGPAALQHHESLVMVQEGGVLATATVADYGRWALVCAIAVAPAHDRRGYGLRLLAAAQAQVTANAKIKVHRSLVHDSACLC